MISCAFFRIRHEQVQDQEVGDGTTSVVVLAAELLKEAEKLVAQRVHPQLIIDGFRLAAVEADAALERASERIDLASEAARSTLMSIARTTLSSKILSQHREHFAGIAVDAILRLKGSGNLQAIQVDERL